jgi:uncharacterized coiled-coil protein SlyX
MSGSNTDRIAALEALVEEQSRDIDTLENAVATLEADRSAQEARIVALEARGTMDERPEAGALPRGGRTGEVPTQQDTTADLAALDAWLTAQTGVGLEYQLQRMCIQFYGAPPMPPS